MGVTETAGQAFDGLLTELEQTLDSEQPEACELRKHGAALQALGARLSGLGQKIDDLATVREFADKVGLHEH